MEAIAAVLRNRNIGESAVAAKVVETAMPKLIPSMPW
jgi:hypothetical protein